MTEAEDPLAQMALDQARAAARRRRSSGYRAPGRQPADGD